MTHTAIRALLFLCLSFSLSLSIVRGWFCTLHIWPNWRQRKWFRWSWWWRLPWTDLWCHRVWQRFPLCSRMRNGSLGGIGDPGKKVKISVLRKAKLNFFCCLRKHGSFKHKDLGWKSKKNTVPCVLQLFHIRRLEASKLNSLDIYKKKVFGATHFPNTDLTSCWETTLTIFCKGHVRCDITRKSKWQKKYASESRVCLFDKTFYIPSSSNNGHLKGGRGRRGR